MLRRRWGAADAIFPKQLAQSPMPPVTPVPHSRKRKPTLAAQMLSAAAPSCTLQIPSKLEEGEVWERIRQAPPSPWLLWYSLGVAESVFWLGGLEPALHVQRPVPW